MRSQHDRQVQVKARIGEGFGERLAAIRKGRGLSQEKLGEAVGVSQRVIAYYEAPDAQPPGPMLSDLAQALGVSTDELLGVAPVPEDLATPRAARLLERLRAAAELPPHDQRAVITFVEALLDKRGVRKAS